MKTYSLVHLQGLFCYMLLGIIKHCDAQAITDWFETLNPPYIANVKQKLPFLPGSACSIYMINNWFSVLEQNCTSVPQNMSVDHNEMFLHNTVINEIPTGAFDSWFNLVSLKITSNDRLTAIHPGSFRNLSRLTTLIITENPQLRPFVEETFTGLVQLKHLQLLRNNILNVKHFSFALSAKVLPNLYSLEISGNSIPNVLKEDLHPMKGSSLKKFIMMLTKTAYIQPGSFNDLSNLRLLNLGGNYLNGSVAADLVASLKKAGSSIKYLSLQLTFINDQTQRLLNEIASSNISDIDLSGIRFGALQPGFFPYMPNIELLNMSSCMIDDLPEGVINNDLMPQLKYLILSKNQLPGIQKSMAVHSLQLLDVSHNIGTVDLNTHFIISSLFVNMTNLKALDLHGNVILPIRKDKFKCCPNLQYLSLRSSSIQVVGEMAFESIPNLIFLDLRNNPFGSTEMLSKNVFRGLTNLKTLDLSSCSISSLPPDVFMHLKKLDRLSLKENKLNTISSETFSHSKRITSIDLSNNPVGSWNHSIFSSQNILTNLILQSCQLTEITPAMIADFSIAKNVDISKNSIICDCLLHDRIASVVSKIKHFALEGDINVCSNPLNYRGIPIQKYWKQTDKDKACKFIPFGIKVTIIIGSVIVLLLAVATVYFYFKWELIYWWYKVKNKHRWLNCMRLKKEDSNSEEYKYDAFISFSHEDRKFVSKMRAVLEGEYKLKLCVYDRDFRAGELITEAVMESVISSRITIMVLSEAFAKSHWCLWELHIAQQRAMFFRKADPDALVIVKLTDIDETLMTNTLKHLMSTRIYIEWSPSHSKQRVFWQKLKTVIYKN